MLPRLILLPAAVCSLSSCGTASHYLGMASGLVNSITSPVLGAIRLSDTPDVPVTTASSATRPPAKGSGRAPDAPASRGCSPAAKPPAYDSRRPPAKRSD